jgi:hypothetical protein
VNKKIWNLLLILVLGLAGCVEERGANVELSGLNYTDVGISTFSVNGYNGPGIYPNGGGGKFVCCVTIPRKWHAGMTVTVKWIEDKRTQTATKERIVDVPSYTAQDIGTFVVHFYPGDVVKVLVTAKVEGHPDYPYPRPR